MSADGAALKLGGFASAVAGDTTLTLAGANGTANNVVWSIADGAGRVSVVKEGANTWTLDGAQTFSGNLTVRAGTLVVRNADGQPFKWMRLVVKETAATCPRYADQVPSYPGRLQFANMKLLDAAGNRQLVGAALAADDKDIPAGAVGYGCDRARLGAAANQDISGAFNSSRWASFSGVGPQIDKPATWVVCVFHLAEDAPEITSFNFQTRWGTGSDYWACTPTAFTLETEAVVESPAEAAARAKALSEQRRTFVLSVPGQAGERRFVWCHTARGMTPDRDWDASVRFLKENGFTDLIANLAWADCAFYDSQVVPVDKSVATQGDAFEQCRAACRKYGVGFHVWRVCYNMGGRIDRARVARYRAEGRLAKPFDVKAKSPWGTTFCPSHPENQRLEVEAMVELARKGADGIHFDYIRYADRNFCFCDGCRRRFEAQLGRPVVDWPADVRRDATLAAAWKKWRAETISTVVAETARRVRAEFPKVEISIAARPDRDAAYSGDGQDWVRWSKEGWIDILCPMDYTDATPFFRNAARAQRALLAGTRVRVYPGIGLSCWKEDGAEAEKMARHIQALRQDGFDGFAVFALDRRANAAFPLLHEGPTRE